MADLTVLVSPTPLYPRPNSLNFNFARRSQTDLTTRRPVMVTLQTPDPAPSSPPEKQPIDDALLSPPRNTFKASRSPPKRPASAPPTQPSFAIEPQRVPASGPPRSTFQRRVVSSFTSNTPHNELIRPPPPLSYFLNSHPVRPTTFWRKTKRSGVTGPSYSPSSHLIRRSTFIAAGLDLERPDADLSALCVESRVAFLVLGPDHSVQ
ncbi:hypothetical protein BV22DRAFT_1115488 [Leucogyrophana mollusca]|uniref:Uncharacterized protein n=1 Tax=Leucogyrophana mollusca TaxID=85980 RepID=A0ACB8AYR5_9AGAM|nr:hypothetical protein BV22DRAFT_1115488 [Leucogyrophana mollusca]